MKNTALLNALRSSIASGDISKSDVLKLFEEKKTQASSEGSKVSLVLSYIGGIVVFLGISFLIGQNWNQLGDIGQILVTLIFGLVFYFSSLYLDKELSFKHLSQAFYLMGTLLIGSGIFVVMNIANIEQSEETLLLVFFGLGVFQSLTFWAMKKNLALFFAITFFSSALVLVPELELIDYTKNDELFGLIFLFLGAIYITLGRYLSFNIERKPLVPWLFELGSLFALGGLFFLMLEAELTLLWTLLLPILDMAILILSVRFKSRAFLINAGLFLVIDIFYLTGEYFADSLGWPLVLVICGFALVGIGYGFLQFSKKYLNP